MASLAARLLAVLPQTQCTRCGYPDCSAYADAMARGEAPINQCPPGGQQGIQWLAELTGSAPLALNPLHGCEAPRAVAFIDEAWCIGCTLCIKACPVDAIVGSNKRMHTVIESHCTGCELCLPACPVDCILLENVTNTATGWRAWSQPQADHAKARYEFRQQRQARETLEHQQRQDDKARRKLADLPHHSQHTDPAILDKKRAVIEAALARARAKRDATTGSTGED